MQPYKTKVNKVSSQYQENYKRNQELVADLNTQLGKALEQGKPEHIKRHIEGGRLLARDRIELLLDQVHDNIPHRNDLIFRQLTWYTKNIINSKYFNWPMTNFNII